MIKKLGLIFLIIVGVLIASMFVPIIPGSSETPGEAGQWNSIANLLTATGYGLTIFIVALVIFAVVVLVFIISLIKGIIAIIKVGIFLFIAAVVIFVVCTVMSIVKI